ncbi:hypothetical protein DYB32_009887 [Aphanomyces invadans]|uniref:Uncharacterized protein n=1 Tax=Aphanomyces invadans TaxID=157072 RepID=A0A3R6YRX7_9STRA|nr:hypothetical protein DYB32_009887 [Aphanomyces invadans]
MAQVVGCIHILAMDIWSQIRKDVAVAVGRVVPAFPWATVEAILHDLLQVCKTPDEDWKALEGAFGVLASMLNQFQKTSPSGFRLGSRTMQYLPSALLCDLKPYAAAPAWWCVRILLTGCRRQISTFQEVMSKLNLYSPHEVLPAAHAEGLLDVAAQLVPHIPLAFLTKHWQVVFPTCEKYVMHALLPLQAWPVVFNEWDEDDTLTPTPVASGAGASLDAKAKCFHDFWSEFDAPRGSPKPRRFSDLIFATCTHDERRRLEAYVASLDRSATRVI